MTSETQDGDYFGLPASYDSEQPVLEEEEHKPDLDYKTYHIGPFAVDSFQLSVISLMSVIVVIFIVLAAVHGSTKGDSRYSGTFLHISDVHLDTLYTSTCDHTTFCRQVSGQCKAVPSSPWGQFKCDSPEQLVASTLRAMKMVDSSPTFIVITGDMVAHRSNSSALSLATIKRVVELIVAEFPHVPVYPTLGNNDVHPDYCIPTPSPVTTQWLEDTGNIYSTWLKGDELITYKSGGYFSTTPVPGLRLISLNTLFYSKNRNSHCSLSSRNPDHLRLAAEYYNKRGISLQSSTDDVGQFAWLTQELSAAKSASERVIIFGHISPGYDTFAKNYTWTPAASAQFTSLVSQYSTTIEMQLYAHFHKDEYRVQLSNGKPVSASMLMPAITPVYLNNPSFRQVQFHRGHDDAKFTLTDYHHYYLDLVAVRGMSTSPTIEQGAAMFQHEYSYRSAYSQPDLNVASIANVTKLMRTNSMMLNAYLSRRVVLYTDSADASLIGCGQTSFNEAEWTACEAASDRYRF